MSRWEEACPYILCQNAIHNKLEDGTSQKFEKSMVPGIAVSHLV